MNILIVENEPIASEYLQKLINDHFDDCKVIGSATSVAQASKMYKSLKPDILIMDINLGDHLSFELFDILDSQELNVVFTTGYQEFAYKAFQVQAVDYVMKPINIDDLRIAINKARDRLKFILLNAQNLQKNSKNESKTFGVILEWENDKLKPIEIENIIKIKSDRNYSTVFVKGNKKLSTSKNLGTYEVLLKDKGFVRIYKSCLINVLHFVSYKPGINAKVELSDQVFEPISRRKKDELMGYLKRNN